MVLPVFVNGMIRLMVTKMMTNDMPHAAGILHYDKEALLNKLLSANKRLMSDYYPQVHGYIIRTYRFEKPLTNIEMYSATREQMHQFASQLNEFFFTYVSPDSSGVYISRFKTLIDTVERMGDLNDSKADLAGILYGYSPKQVAEYINKMSSPPIRGLIKE